MPRTQVTVAEARKLAGKALLGGGGHTGPLTVEWKLAGDCRDPVYLQVHGRPTEAAFSRHSMFVDLYLRCRKCDQCLRVRSRLWRARAVEEISDAQRTWFGTLTLDMERQMYALNRARSNYRKREGSELDAAAFKDQLLERHRVISPWLTLWLKRVRKESGARLRYLLVMEPHKSGAPHYHCLVHECEADAPVRHRTLTGQWPNGFTKFNLVEGTQHAGYVCKYLSKNAVARVRASKRYGQRIVPPIGWNGLKGLFR